ncbi:hypothetical protein [Georgenia sp. SUBG003]|uniref:hypothetical protein n=1 Tax=Georgenia sp. SUBG003 TaxID=1497974 RepID=UPI003AB3FBB8
MRPEITLPGLDGIELSVDQAAVSDDDVTAKLDELRERFGSLVGVERPAQDGDFVVIDLSARARAVRARAAEAELSPPRPAAADGLGLPPVVRSGCPRALPGPPSPRPGRRAPW